MSSLVSESDWKNALVTLSQFVFLGEKAFLRDTLFANAVEIALFLHDDKAPFSPGKLQEILRNDMWGINLPSSVIERVCNELAHKSNVIKLRKSFRLSYKRKQEINNKIDKVNIQRKEVEAIFIELVVKEYRKRAKLSLFAKDQELCVEQFWNYVSKLISYRVNALIQLFASSDFKAVSLTHSLFEELSKPIPDVDLRGAFQSSFEGLFRYKIGKFLSFLFKSTQLLTCWKILNVDPSAKVLQKTEFQNKRLILDTNCVMDLLCRSSDEHTGTSELVYLTSSLKMKVSVTTRTLDELRKVLDRSNERMLLLDVPINILTRINDPFISSFAYERSKDESLSWNRFYERNSEPRDYLKTQFNIEVINVEDSREKFRIDNKTYEKTVEEVQRAWQNRWGYSKTQYVAEHDAFHLILIKELREQDVRRQVLGPNYWLLTRDSSLQLVEPFLNSLKVYKRKSISSAIRRWAWLDFITPFLSSNVRNEEAYVVFADLLRSSFSVISYGINPRILTEVQGEWTSYRWLSVDDIEEILKDKVLTDFALKLSKLKDEDKIKNVVFQLRTRFDTILGKKFDQKMDSVNKKLEERDTEIVSLKSEIFTENRFKRLWRTISGVLGAILVISSLVSYLINQPQTPFTIIMGCLILISGVILLLMAIAYKQVKAQLKVVIGKDGP